jgi:hypothetical protein
MRRAWLLTLAAAGCGLSVVETGKSDELGSSEHLLTARVREVFGASAQVRETYGAGDRVVVAVALEPSEPESDVIPPVALGAFDKHDSSLEVLAREALFREARLLGDGRAALVSDDGQLQLRAKDGALTLLATQVRGDVTPSADGASLALTLVGPEGDDGETAVALTDLSGNLQVLADSDGVDDRPALSPDGQTVVFVSGRSGVASLWRTTTTAEAAVQLTNVGLEPTGDDVEPRGFVPPPVSGARLTWVSNDVLRYDAGGGEYWQVNVRTGNATREGGAP